MLLEWQELDAGSKVLVDDSKKLTINMFTLLIMNEVKPLMAGKCWNVASFDMDFFEFEWSLIWSYRLC